MFNIVNDIETFSQNNLKGKAEHGMVLHYDLKYVNIPYIWKGKNDWGKWAKMLSASFWYVGFYL